ncbi:MAG: sugar MFS transporter [Sporocytophaga sp.]|uniref:sugar MFS transporter n=1 Tax=Sporocytophaga sp. TaxID=2231183 RepID=UPI001B25ED44|nr:sugar MFS transporter [Sporocytophaga sp.]MBO9701473.1 sugar MFS transporter [Sporocytophaga sp.]
MATFGKDSKPVEISGNENTNYSVPLALMVSLFFMIGFITVMNDVLIPSLKGLFELRTWQAMLIQFCFFGAYFLMSIPSGYLIERIGYKKGLAISLSVMGGGLLLFVPASIIISYPFFLLALFIVAVGLTILQVAINPYIVALGPEETGASRLNLGGALNSTATFIGPIIGGAFIFNPDLIDTSEKAAAVRGPYIGLALLTFGIGVILYFLKLPKIKSEVEKGEKLEGSILDFGHLISGAGAIFFYVGAEVAIGSILILYLVEDNLIRASSDILSQFKEESLASSLLSYYWGSAMIGRLIGSAIGQKVRAEIMLRIVAFLAILFVGISVTGLFDADFISIKIMVLDFDLDFPVAFKKIEIPFSILLLILVGLLNSVMWPCIFPLSLAGLGKFTSKGSGILVTMVVGGAIIPLIQAGLAEKVGYTSSFLVVLLCYLYIFYFSVKGYKNTKILASGEAVQ